MKDAFVLMAQNNAWANTTLYAALAGLSDSAFSGPRPGFFPSLKRTLNHIYEVDLYYIDALQETGQGRSVYDRTDVGSCAALAKLQTALDQELIRFCETLRPQDLDSPRLTRRETGDVYERVGPLLLHLFQHQIHHRGQAHTMVHHAGIAPPQLDDFYLEYGRAPTAARYFAEPLGTTKRPQSGKRGPQ